MRSLQRRRFDVGPPFVGQEPLTRSTEELLCWWPEVIPAQWGLCRIINQPFHDAMAFLPHRSIFASPLRIHQQVRRLNLWIARRAQVRVINRLAC